MPRNSKPTRVQQTRAIYLALYRELPAYCTDHGRSGKCVAHGRKGTVVFATKEFIMVFGVRNTEGRSPASAVYRSTRCSFAEAEARYRKALQRVMGEEEGCSTSQR